MPHRTDDGIGWRRELTLSLTIDHRAVDGAPGAEFLQSLVETLANPSVVTGSELDLGGRCERRVCALRVWAAASCHHPRKEDTRAWPWTLRMAHAQAHVATSKGLNSLL